MRFARLLGFRIPALFPISTPSPPSALRSRNRPIHPSPACLIGVNASDLGSGRRRTANGERRRTSNSPRRPCVPVTPGLFYMAGSEEIKGVIASVGELRIVASSSREGEIARHDNGGADVAADDDIWDDASDSPDHGSTLDREWTYRQSQFHKMGYRDGRTEGQKDAAQEGFNVGFRQSVHVGCKWGIVRGVTSALASLPDSLKEKLLPNAQCRGKLQDLHNSVQEISADDALQMFHESILQNNHPSEEPHVISEADRATDSSRLQSLSKDLVLLLHECPDIKVAEELTQDS